MRLPRLPRRRATALLVVHGAGSPTYVACRDRDDALRAFAILQAARPQPSRPYTYEIRPLLDSSSIP